MMLHYSNAGVNPRLVADQLQPFALSLVKSGQRPHALLVATNDLYEALRVQQPSRVFFEPPQRAFNGAGTLRNRVH